MNLAEYTGACGQCLKGGACKDARNAVMGCSAFTLDPEYKPRDQLKAELARALESLTKTEVAFAEYMEANPVKPKRGRPRKTDK